MPNQFGNVFELFLVMFVCAAISCIILGVTSFYDKSKDLNDIKTGLWFGGGFSGISTIFAGVLIFHEFKWYWKLILAVILICFCAAAVIAFYYAGSQDISYASARPLLIAGWGVCLAGLIASTVFLCVSINQKYPGWPSLIKSKLKESCCCLK